MADADGDLVPPRVVMHCAHDLVHAGFAGDDAPRVEFPTAMCRTRRQFLRVGFTRTHEVGDVALDRVAQDSVTQALSWPVDERGIIANWDDMEKIWEHAFFSELRVAPEDHALMLSEPPLQPQSHSERTTQIMFETFNVPALCLINQAVPAAIGGGAGRIGVAVYSDEHFTSVTTVHELFALPHTASPVASGRDVTNALQKLIAARHGQHTGAAASRAVVEDIKQKLACVGMVGDKLGSYGAAKPFPAVAGEQMDYELPDGEVLSVGDERFRCSECIFAPTGASRWEQTAGGEVERSGLAAAVFALVMKCDPQIRQDLFKNVALSGSNTLMPGFSERLQRELQELAYTPWDFAVRVIAQPERRTAVWIGLSVLASLESVDSQYWMTQAEYNEHGPTLVHRKGTQGVMLRD